MAEVKLVLWVYDCALLVSLPHLCAATGMKVSASQDCSEGKEDWKEPPDGGLSSRTCTQAFEESRASGAVCDLSLFPPERRSSNIS